MKNGKKSLFSRKKRELLLFLVNIAYLSRAKVMQLSWFCGNAKMKVCYFFIKNADFLI